MSEDADPELLELLRQHLGLGPSTTTGPPETRVLSSAEYICDHSIDVALDNRSTKQAAETIYKQMQEQGYSTASWSEHELHPKVEEFGEEGMANFIFTMDLLNFCFWSEKSGEERFGVEYRGKRWTGYWSLVAALRRAIGEDIPITTPAFWVDEERFTEEVLRNVFRSTSEEEIPLFEQRYDCLREAGKVLLENFNSSITDLIAETNHSAAGLVNLLANEFPCFRDEMTFEGRNVRFLKRAQILVADLWAAFQGEGIGTFDDIDKITMFADYRIPQILHTFGSLLFSPPLESRIRRKAEIEPGSTWEVELRGCSIWCIELIRREIIAKHPEAEVNAILIDFFLYDLVKEMEKEGNDQIPHHRTRSIWY